MSKPKNPDNINSPEAVARRWFKYSAKHNVGLELKLWHGRTVEESLLRACADEARFTMGDKHYDEVWELERRGYLTRRDGSDDSHRFTLTTLGCARIVELTPCAAPEGEL